MQTIPEPPNTPRNNSDAACIPLALLLGVAFTLVVRGYQFGGGNHNVYLLEPLRESSPPLLAHDWFTTQTLQYHGVFNHLCVWLMRLHVLQPAFLAGYLGLVALLHVTWLRWVRAMGGTCQVYLVSVVLFYLSAGGVGLGMYDFLQDGSFLPSNIASVLMLAGLCAWVTGSRFRAGTLLGVAGLFHLNYALVGIGMWGAMGTIELRVEDSGLRETSWRLLSPKSSVLSPRMLAGTFMLLALCIPNILPAVRSALSQSHHMPLTDFVALYVRVRHPHHYDPSSWPIALWVSFLWPFPLAILATRRSPATPERRETYRIVVLMTALLAVALLGAGVWYVSEPLIQMSLFRFSVYPKLLTCVGAAYWLCSQGSVAKRLPQLIVAMGLVVGVLAAGAGVLLHGVAADFVRENEWMLFLFAVLSIASGVYLWLSGPLSSVPRGEGGGEGSSTGKLESRSSKLESNSNFEFSSLDPSPQPSPLGTGERGPERLIALLLVLVMLIATWRHLGIRVLPGTIDSADYLKLCEFARDHTPVDAVFLVPPQEESMRYHGQRAVVVNFKCVPQFSGELGEWRDRLQIVLDLPDLRTLPHRFDLSTAAIGRRYDALSAAHLERAAQTYGATYVISTHALNGVHGRMVFENDSYRLYALDRK